MANRHALIASLLLMTVAAASAPLSAQPISRSFAGSLTVDEPNDVRLIEFTLASTASFNVQTWSFGGSGSAPGGVNAAGAVITDGGFDTYLSLFSGFGPSALFLTSNDDGLCPPGTASPTCADSTLNIASLAAGDYTLALTTFGNISFAENLSTGALGDGFVGFGNFDGRGAQYALDIETDFASAVPAPGVFLLLAIGVAGAVLLHKLTEQRNTTRSKLCKAG